MDINKDLTLELLLASPAGDRLEKALDSFEKTQEDLLNLHAHKDEKATTLLKAGTILLLAVAKKIMSGKFPTGFSRSDWEEITNTVSKYAVKMDNQQYSAFVFLFAEKYIRLSLSVFDGIIPPRYAEQIEILADELVSLTEELENGSITEVAYIDKCMWITLEAMIKLLSVNIGSFGGNKAIEYADAISMLAFEYGRYHLLQKEDRLLTEYLDNQKALDERLETEFNAYLKELNAETEKFNELIANAFDPNFKDMLQQSAELARAAGVPEDEILDTDKKLFEFFLG